MNDSSVLIKELCVMVNIPFEKVIKKTDSGVDRYSFLLNDNYLVNVFIKENKLIIKGEVDNIYTTDSFCQDISLEALKLNLSLGLVAGPWLIYEEEDSTLYIVNILSWDGTDSAKLKDTIENLVNQQINIREMISKFRLNIIKQDNIEKKENKNPDSKFVKVA